MSDIDIDVQPTQPTRVMKKIARDVPPSIPFLEFDSVVWAGISPSWWR